jgi:hypothetical protein
MPSGVLPIVLGAWLVLTGHAPPQPTAAADCSDWRECREHVEQAIASGDVDRAPDLAWRAVQRGPKDDAALMFLWRARRAWPDGPTRRW